MFSQLVFNDLQPRAYAFTFGSSGYARVDNCFTVKAHLPKEAAPQSAAARPAADASKKEQFQMLNKVYAARLLE